MKKIINISGKVLNEENIKDITSILAHYEKTNKFEIGAYTELGEKLYYYSFMINENYEVLLMKIGSL